MDLGTGKFFFTLFTHLCDYHLEAGRLCRAEGKEKEAKEHFLATQELIDATGYHRRDMAHEFPRISTNF